jgi:hypothetical protein
VEDLVKISTHGTNSRERYKHNDVMDIWTQQFFFVQAKIQLAHLQKPPYTFMYNTLCTPRKKTTHLPKNRSVHNGNTAFFDPLPPPCTGDTIAGHRSL